MGEPGEESKSGQDGEVAHSARCKQVNAALYLTLPATTTDHRTVRLFASSIKQLLYLAT
jgi:hypothetical protein